MTGSGYVLAYEIRDWARVRSVTISTGLASEIAPQVGSECLAGPMTE